MTVKESLNEDRIIEDTASYHFSNAIFPALSSERFRNTTPFGTNTATFIRSLILNRQAI
jgi:hypothetical protein